MSHRSGSLARATAFLHDASALLQSNEEDLQAFYVGGKEKRESVVESRPADVEARYSYLALFLGICYPRHWTSTSRSSVVGAPTTPLPYPVFSPSISLFFSFFIHLPISFPLYFFSSGSPSSSSMYSPSPFTGKCSSARLGPAGQLSSIYASILSLSLSIRWVPCYSRFFAMRNQLLGVCLTRKGERERIHETSWPLLKKLTHSSPSLSTLTDTI